MGTKKTPICIEGFGSLTMSLSLADEKRTPLVLRENWRRRLHSFCVRFSGCRHSGPAKREDESEKFAGAHGLFDSSAVSDKAAHSGTRASWVGK
jgi:hypothetical protein